MPFFNKKPNHNGDYSHSKSISAASIKSTSAVLNRDSSRLSTDYSRNRHSTIDLRSSMVSNISGSNSNYDNISNSEKTLNSSLAGSLSDQLEVHTLNKIYSADTLSPLSSTSLTKINRNSLSYANEISGNGYGSTNSRKSSGNSVNSLSFDKMILTWDPTDPEEWNMQRIISWLKYQDFPDSWILTFKKYQLIGQKFIKLLAYENFAVYEKYLLQSKNGSYTRFQLLLKQTMSKNVTNNRHKGLEQGRISRSSSESLQSKTKSSTEKTDSKGSRSTSESAISPTTSGPAKYDDKHRSTVQLRSHHKTKSASSLYRKSFISLRSSSSNNNHSSNKTPTSNIKLKIPSRPSSIIESTSSSSKSSTPPLSPTSYPNIFRRSHKSSSSESSLLNMIFGSSHNNYSNANGNGNISNVATPATNRPTSINLKLNSTSSSHFEKSHRPSNRSSDSITRTPYPSSNVISPTKPNSSEEKGNIWEKIKRRSQFSSPHTITVLPIPAVPSRSSSIITLTPGKITDTPTPTSPTKKSMNLVEKTNEDYVSSPTLNNLKPKEVTMAFTLDVKFYPGNDKTNDDETYILITKDNRLFAALNLDPIDSIETLKEGICLKLNLSTKELTIHMTNFKGELGLPLSDELLSSLIRNSFATTTMQFYIKDHSKAQTRIRASTLSNDVHNSLRSIKSKGSVKSIASSAVANADNISIITSSSDITSSEDHSPSAGFRRYPQTPSYYYEGAILTNSGSEEINYWNVKEPIPDDTSIPTTISKPAQKFTLHLPDKKRPVLNLSNEPEAKETFNILRKDDSGEIDFNKRRESPYVIPELAPKRDAPRAPTNVSPPRSVSISSHAAVTPHLRRTSTKRKMKNMIRPIPSALRKAPVETTSPSSDTLVSSYTPASTHVLVPQPYKGVNEITRKNKTEEDLAHAVSSSVAKKGIDKSGSNISTPPSVFSTPSPLLKRGSSRRIVSSASAADVFEENDITFADAPALSEEEISEQDESYDSDSSGDIIWSTNTRVSDKPQTDDTVKGQITTNTGDNDIKTHASTSVDHKEKPARKMTLRPSPEVVYQNLEMFFPSANLDKPVVEGGLTPTSPISMKQAFQSSQAKNLEHSTVKTKPNFNYSNSQDDIIPSSSGNHLLAPKRTKTIRTIAHEASEKRKHSIKLKRQNTKMWGTRMIEITDKQSVAINKSKNSKGEYKEFAWIKGEMIGKGSFGAVYLCLNATTGEMMAVKQVEVPKYSSQNENIMSMVEALQSEVSTLKDLDHLNIVQYLGFENKDNIYSLFLEYVAGGSVGSLIRMYGRFDEPLIKHLTTQVLRGLAYLHSRGILHRDMKADNLLLDQDGICKISDFGISKKSKDIYSNSDMTMRGTVFWMAPEMVDTKQGYSAKVDIWALGCVVLEMFAGKRPWSNLEVVAAMFKIGKAKSAPPIPDDTLPLISYEGRKFIDACFEINPDLRPTADTLLFHPFITNNRPYDFKSTELWKFIKSNDKINSTKLRVSSQDSTKRVTI